MNEVGQGNCVSIANLVSLRIFSKSLSMSSNTPVNYVNVRMEMYRYIVSYESSSLINYNNLNIQYKI